MSDTQSPQTKKKIKEFSISFDRGRAPTAAEKEAEQKDEYEHDGTDAYDTGDHTDSQASSTAAEDSKVK